MASLNGTSIPERYKLIEGQIRDVLAGNEKRHGFAMMFDVPQADGTTKDEKVFFSFNTFRLPARYAYVFNFGPKPATPLVAPEPGDRILALIGENDRTVIIDGEEKQIKSKLLSAWTLKDLQVCYHLRRGIHTKWGGDFDPKTDKPSNDLFDCLIANFAQTKEVRLDDGRVLSARLTYKVMNPDGLNFDDKEHVAERLPAVPRFLIDEYNAARHSDDEV